VNPKTKNSLIGFSKLTGSSKNPTPIYPHGKAKCGTIFQGQQFRTSLGTPIEGNRGFRGKCLGQSVLG
jgi:hypothetical protein